MGSSQGAATAQTSLSSTDILVSKVDAATSVAKAIATYRDDRDA